MAVPQSNTVPLAGNPLIDGSKQSSAWSFSGGPHTLADSLYYQNATIGQIDHGILVMGL